jgi:hypothetical protein
MEFKDIVAISGMPGLYETLRQRPDGIIAQGLGEKKSRYISNRIHTFSPLDKISIYTEGEDSVLLEVVFRLMQEQELSHNNVPPKAKSSSDVLRGYFKTILADYDEERVYVSDIKKVIKWYLLLKQFDAIPPEEVEETVAEEETTATENVTDEQ